MSSVQWLGMDRQSIDVLLDAPGSVQACSHESRDDSKTLSKNVTLQRLTHKSPDGPPPGLTMQVTMLASLVFSGSMEKIDVRAR